MLGLIDLDWPKQAPGGTWNGRANQGPSALNSEAIPDLVDEG